MKNGCGAHGDRLGAHRPAQIDGAIAEEAMRWKRPVYIEVRTPGTAQRAGPRCGQLPLSRSALDSPLSKLKKAGQGENAGDLGGPRAQRFGLQDKLLEIMSATGLSYATDLIGKGVLPKTRPASSACRRRLGGGGAAQPRQGVGLRPRLGNS